HLRLVLNDQDPWFIGRISHCALIKPQASVIPNNSEHLASLGLALALMAQSRCASRFDPRPARLLDAITARVPTGGSKQRGVRARWRRTSRRVQCPADPSTFRFWHRTGQPIW